MIIIRNMFTVIANIEYSYLYCIWKEKLLLLVPESRKFSYGAF